MHKRLIMFLSIVLVLLAMIAPAIYAGKLDIEATPIRNSIYANESALFNITIRNGLENDSFQIYTLDVDWDLTTDPSEDRYFELAEGDDKTIKLILAPLDVQSGLQGIALNFKGTKTGYFTTKSIFVDVKPSEPVVVLKEYLPAIRIDSQIEPRIDPRRGGVLKVSLENRNPRDIESLKIYIRSDFLNKDYETSLAPKGRLNSDKTLEFPIETDPMQLPTTGKISVWATTEALNKTYQFQADDILMDIVSYGEILEEKQTSSAFLTKKEVLTFRNTGNIPRTKVLEIPVSTLELRHSTYDPMPQIIQTEDGVILQWKIDLSLDEEAKITLTTDYHPIFKMVMYPVIIAILVIIAYYILRSSIVASKKVKVLKKEHGGISTVDVRITLRNRGLRKVKETRVTDILPSLIDFDAESHGGMMHPTKILKHEKKGTFIQWDLGEIDPLEERIITYRATAKLGIMGKFMLPPVTVRYGFKEGKMNHKTKSTNI